MIKNVLGSSTTVSNASVNCNDIPVIHVHNRVPFANYEAAVEEIEQKVLHPGECAIVYYYDSAKPHGIAC